jgi:hypothetical protein
MSIKKHFTPIIVILVLLTGCVSSSRQTPNPSKQSSTPMPRTVTPEPTVPITPFITLKPNEAKSALQRLLIQQEFCRPPCFWGIAPNHTTLKEAQNIFAYFGIPLSQTNQTNGKDYFATDFGLQSGLSVSIVLGVQSDLVDSLRTNIGLANYTSSPAVREWLAFSPETILTQYGIPTYVEFGLAVAPNDQPSSNSISYAMILYFDSYDLVIEYDSKLIKDEKVIKVCPLIDSFDGIWVWSGKNAENMPTRQGISLEEAAVLTNQQFHDLMLQDPQNACIGLSRDAFQK